MTQAEKNTPQSSPAIRVLTGGNKKIVMLPIEQVLVAFYVRKQADEDRVIYFAELYDNGAEIPPIEVTVDNKLVDGRHRLMAQEFLERKEIACEIVESKETALLIQDAFTANLGGSKPPTRYDIEHTARLLLEEGMKPIRIIEFYSGHIPKSLARRYVDNARLHLKRDKIRYAREAVINGATVREAAEKHGIDLDELKNEIAGNKKRKKKGNTKDIKGGLTTLFRSNSQRWSAQMGKLRDMYEDDQLDSTEVTDVINHLEHLLKQAQRTFNNNKDRLQKVMGLKEE